MSEQLLSIGEVEICVESFGIERDPCVLLLMGAMASMLWWDDGLCSALAERSLYVVRFDNRDVGRSSCGPPGELDYDVDDMVRDATGVLDALGVARAHWVGMSLGGMLAQVAALRYPSRVASIVAIASGVWDDRPDLPAADSAIAQYHAGAANIDWGDETQVRDYLVGGWRLLAGTRHPFDEQQASKLAVAEIRRSRSLLSMFNHAQLTGAEDLYGSVRNIAVPLLVIHGTKDPVLPFPHAEALAREAPHARLMKLEGGGHEIHRADWPLICDAIEATVRSPQSYTRGCAAFPPRQ